MTVEVCLLAEDIWTIELEENIDSAEAWIRTKSAIQTLLQSQCYRVWAQDTALQRSICHDRIGIDRLSRHQANYVHHPIRCWLSTDCKANAFEHLSEVHQFTISLLCAWQNELGMGFDHSHPPASDLAEALAELANKGPADRIGRALIYRVSL
jgi:hypothetical protein